MPNARPPGDGQRPGWGLMGCFHRNAPQRPRSLPVKAQLKAEDLLRPTLAGEGEPPSGLRWHFYCHFRRPFPAACPLMWRLILLRRRGSRLAAEVRALTQTKHAYNGRGCPSTRARTRTEPAFWPLLSRVRPTSPTTKSASLCETKKHIRRLLPHHGHGGAKSKPARGPRCCGGRGCRYCLPVARVRRRPK